MNTKLRESKESKYNESNSDVRSVCKGEFYIRCKNMYEKCTKCENCIKYKMYRSKSDDAPEVKFRYVDSFRKCNLYKDNADIIRNNVVSSIYKILYLNELALYFVMDIYSVEDLSDKESKRLVNALKKRQYGYEKMMKEILQSQELPYLDFCDALDELIRPIGKKMREDIISEYIKYTENKKVAERVGFINTGIIFVALATKMREFIVGDLFKVSKDAIRMNFYNLGDMRHVLEDLMKWETRNDKEMESKASIGGIIKDGTSNVLKYINSNIYQQLKNNEQ